MRKVAPWYCGDQFRGGAPEICLHFVRSADSDVSELAITIVCEIHMIGNRSRIQRRLELKRRLGVVHLYFADILQGEPYFVIFRTHSDVRAKRTRLRQTRHNLMRGHLNNIEFRGKTGTDKAILAVWTKHGHPWAIDCLNAADFLH